MSDSRKATDRLLAIARSLQHPDSNYGLPEEFMRKLRAALLSDPLLPRPNPSISLWQEPAHPTVSSIQSPTLPQYADIVVIGSGITGCSVTKALLEDDSLDTTSRIVVLEARTLTSGATGRNGGQLVSPVGHLYNTMCKRHGEETAKEMCRFSFMNIERIMGMLEELDPELRESSEIRHVHKVMVAGDEETWKSSKESLNSFREAISSHQTIHRVTEQDGLAKEFNIKNGHGVIDHPAGAVWPYRLITGIFERLLVQYHDRLSIETNTPATAIKYTSGAASDGSSISDYPGTMSVQKAGPYLQNVGNSRSWSYLTKSTLDPVSERFDGGLYYLQQHAATGDVWIGTDYSNVFDVLTSDDTAVPGHSVEALLKFLPKYFVKGWPEDERPELKGVWTGLQGHTSDGLPLVGKLPKSVSGRDGDGEWIAGGYSGYGMDKAWMTGEAIASMVTGKGVPEWLPKAFLLTDQRLERDITVEKSVVKWVSIAKTGDW
ncbi:gamma-glutamylputrescine oxidoreductase [Fusarium tjaetaba]|uniref:Gamma-glutamylputrescine oxidoreductase n=1 Tax=Fusarium tjaetaba TaxID=1567544 RepID=A0A8H5S157_9HYPO|nr:gamma-glutamylputrescine oxidoreductase [Fusarium tjaetaba]KAF5643557.1 gamma-glutamylputrescine oxidoreductase [Fusarium tjaetaba]